MKAYKYYAPEAYGAWAKTGYLFENGIFLCEFKYYNKPQYICREYDFYAPPKKMTWGKNVVDHYSEKSESGAFADYQTFQLKEKIEKNFEQMKNSLLSRKVPFWSENHHSSKKLN